jgi:hypothetical protein
MPNAPRTYFWSNGISLAPDGRELTLDYSDPDQGGTRLCFRYVITPQSSPRLITGYAHESHRSPREISYDQIPQDVFSDAQHWLKSNLDLARASGKEMLSRILMEYLESLRQREVGPPQGSE